MFKKLVKPAYQGNILVRIWRTQLLPQTSPEELSLCLMDLSQASQIPSLLDDLQICQLC